MLLSAPLKQSIAGKFNVPVSSLQLHSVGGGCINQTYRLTIPGGSHFFCKINSASKFPQLFEKEQKGLQALSRSHAIRTPEAVGVGEAENEQYLLLEWINDGPRTKRFWESFGRQLAALHCSTATEFGWDEDNYMGSILQRNKKEKDWATFFTRQRLQPLLDQCRHRSVLHNRHFLHFERLFTRLKAVFNDEPPSLLHGDLWSGNFLCNEQEEPVLIDPAVSFGHRSADMAMTALFGGFDKTFYEAYQYHFPLPANYREQWAVCNLYPLLIHLLLFGSSYLPQIEQTLNAFQ